MTYTTKTGKIYKRKPGPKKQTKKAGGSMHRMGGAVAPRKMGQKKITLYLPLKKKF